MKNIKIDKFNGNILSFNDKYYKKSKENKKKIKKLEEYLNGIKSTKIKTKYPNVNKIYDSSSFIKMIEDNILTKSIKLNSNTEISILDVNNNLNLDNNTRNENMIKINVIKNVILKINENTDLIISIEDDDNKNYMDFTQYIDDLEYVCLCYKSYELKIVFNNVIENKSTNDQIKINNNDTFYIKINEKIKVKIKSSTNDKRYYTSNVIENIETINRIQNISKNISPKVNIIQHQSMAGYHRAGWEYVRSNYNFENDENANVIFDDYVDATFLWENTQNLPYTQKWYGIIHHTADETFSNYNLVNLFNNELFIQSLLYCNGLIVMTNYLKQIVETKLNDIYLNSVPVYVIYHPTLFVDNLFNITNYLKNNDKKLLHIGGWLRNSYVLYELNNDKFKKNALKGVNMDNYFKPTNFNFNDIISLVDNQNGDNICGNIINENQIESSYVNTNNIIKNKYIDGMIKNLYKNDSSVEIIDYLDNDTYDLYLSENIVFLNLIDASACNTLMECVVRNTPIIINKIDPVKEILGENYPLYYNNISDVESILNILCIPGNKLLIDTYNYIINLDKSQYKINYFIDKLNEIIM